MRKQQNHPPEIYNIVKALAKLGIEHEREAGRSQDRTHCVPVAHGETEHTEGNDAGQEEAFMNKGSEARAAKSLKGHPWGQEPDAMFQELLVRLTDAWTEELFGNLKGAAAPEQLLEVKRLLKNEGEKCKACQKGKNTYKAKHFFNVDMKDHPGMRWIFYLAQRDLTKAFQSLVALEQSGEGGDGVRQTKRVQKQRSKDKEQKVLGRNKLDRTRNSG